MTPSRWIVVAVALVGCEGIERPLPTPVPEPTCAPPTAVPATPYPAGTPNVVGTTRWYRIATLETAKLAEAFDLDGRVHCAVEQHTCVSTGKQRDRTGADATYDMASLVPACSTPGTPTFQYLLRLDDVAAVDDPLVHASLHLAHPTASGGMAVDPSSLEDGVSLDRPRFRLADGFVRDGVFWSVGPAIDKLPFSFAQCERRLRLDIVARPLVLMMRLDGTSGRIGAVVGRSDAEVAGRDLARRLGSCSDAYVPPLDWYDLVEADVKGPHSGACDAISMAMTFVATETEAPTALEKKTPEAFSASDICVSPDASTSSPGCPTGGCAWFGMRADGRLDATVAKVWPDRMSEPALPDDEDLASSCATLASCLPFDDLPGASLVGTGVPLPMYATIAERRAAFAAECASAQSGSGVWQKAEEHGIPMRGTSVRLGALLSIARTAHGDCTKILAVRSPAHGLICDREGCDLAPGGAVECVGNDAHFSATGAVRKCDASFATCSPSSKTGCSDRPVASCPKEAGDRCDGDVLLGCNSQGRVTFRDCGRYGGMCSQTPGGGAVCLFPYGACRALPVCDGDSLVLCTRGADRRVDCKAAGFAGCMDGMCVQ